MRMISEESRSGLLLEFLLTLRSRTRRGHGQGARRDDLLALVWRATFLFGALTHVRSAPARLGRSGPSGSGERSRRSSAPSARLERALLDPLLAAFMAILGEHRAVRAALPARSWRGGVRGGARGLERIDVLGHFRARSSRRALDKRALVFFLAWTGAAAVLRCGGRVARLAQDERETLDRARLGLRARRSPCCSPRRGRRWRRPRRLALSAGRPDAARTNTLAPEVEDVSTSCRIRGDRRVPAPARLPYDGVFPTARPVLEWLAVVQQARAKARGARARTRRTSRRSRSGQRDLRTEGTNKSCSPCGERPHELELFGELCTDRLGQPERRAPAAS
jgi:hypothetical protein